MLRQKTWIQYDVICQIMYLRVNILSGKNNSWLTLGIGWHVGVGVVRLYSHPGLLLLDDTTRSSARGFLMMSCQWMVSAWHKNLFWSTRTPPFSISAEQGKIKKDKTERDGITERIYSTCTPCQEINTPRLTPTLCLAELPRVRCSLRCIWA